MSLSFSVFEAHVGDCSAVRKFLHEDPTFEALDALVRAMGEVGFTFSGMRPPTELEAKGFEHLQGTALLQLYRAAKGPQRCARCLGEWDGLKARVPNARGIDLEQICATCILQAASNAMAMLKSGAQARKAGYLS